MRLVIRSCTLLAIGASLAAAQKLPPIRPLGAVSAVASESLSTVSGLRHLPGGRVLVNDFAQRRVLMLDSTLARIAVVADSTSATGNAYSGRVGGLIAYRGDSTLFVDPQSLSMLVLDPAGKVARVMSVPRSQDAMALVGLGSSATFDGRGRIVYRSNDGFRRMGMAAGMSAAGGAHAAPPPSPPDTAPVVAVDLATRALDTLAWVKIPRPGMNVTRGGDGSISVTMEVNPLPVIDEWAVTSDGALAIVRGRDYHVDWRGADGARTSSAKIPFEWQRLSDEDKIALIDSVRVQRERMAAEGPPAGAPGPLVFSGPAGGGAGERIIVMGGGPGGPGGPPPRGGAAGGPGGAGRGGAGMPAPQVTYVSPSELPDYKPPFFAGAVRADADGNLWVRTIPTRQVPGGPVYDVIDRTGTLVDRVQVPVNRTIVGFGAGGVVYLTGRDGNRAVLERARAR